jgi:glycerol kinase
MKTIITTGLICAVIGAATGWMHAVDHYEAKARKLLEDTEKAEQVRADKSKEQVDELYEKWRDAIVTPEPVTVVERLYVKAKCPVQTDTGTELDHGTDDARVELAERTVRSIERVAIKHEQNYKKCASQLAGAQALLSAE